MRLKGADSAGVNPFASLPVCLTRSVSLMAKIPTGSQQAEPEHRKQFTIKGNLTLSSWGNGVIFTLRHPGCCHHMPSPSTLFGWRLFWASVTLVFTITISNIGLFHNSVRLWRLSPSAYFFFLRKAAPH